jgi:glutathione S-transferase
MGLPYRLRPVDLFEDVTKDTEFMAINPAGFIPALVDGDAVMVESVAIMEYLTRRYGPTPLAPAPGDAGFPAYLQFMHLGEAGLAGPLFIKVVTQILAPAADQNNWSATKAQEVFDSRRRLVERQLARAPYMAGDAFTAADISVTYALEFAYRQGCARPSEAERAYVARTTGREGYKRAMETCAATKVWAESLAIEAD